MGALLDFKLALWLSIGVCLLCWWKQNDLCVDYFVNYHDNDGRWSDSSWIPYCTNAWWCKITHTWVSWARKWDLMLIAYAQKPPLNVHAGVSCGNIGLIIIWVFIYIHTLCMQAVKAMARMSICAGTPQPSLLGYIVCIEISWACPVIWHVCLVSQKLTRDTLDIN